jgi:uncharacterized protein YndB with AHSA1/START domain
MGEKAKGPAGSADAAVPADGDREFVITRVFDASREAVFRAWTEGERLARWWGPKGMAVRIAVADVRPGGILHYSMSRPDRQEMWGRFVYREVDPPRRIVFVNSFSDAAGGIVRAPFLDTFPLEVLSTLTFEEHAGRTTLTLRGVPLNATETELKTFLGMRDSMRAGWTGTLDQLAAHLTTVG